MVGIWRILWASILFSNSIVVTPAASISDKDTSASNQPTIPTLIVMATSYDGAPPPIEEMSEDEQYAIKLLMATFPETPLFRLSVPRALKTYTDKEALCMIGSDREISKGEVSSKSIFKSYYRHYRLRGSSGPIRVVGHLLGSRRFAGEENDSIIVVDGYSFEDLIAKLKRGRVDSVVLGPRASERGFAKRNGLEEVEGSVVGINVRLKCHPTAIGSDMIGEINGRITAPE